jgi:undecaprenyl pyrophosphate synthase
MYDTREQAQNWERRDEELNHRIALFEKEFKHMKPCKRYIETKYCVHLVNAQQKKFGKDANNLLADLVGILQDKQ